MLQLAMSLVCLQVIVLLLIRPLILWYFRVTEVTRLLASIDASLKCLPAVKEKTDGRAHALRLQRVRAGAP